MKVLSLFDGMSCGQLALNKLGIKVDKYYASEIDKYAIQVTQANFPETIQVGDVCNLKAEDYQDIDLILAGSPCQGFSFAGKQLAFDDPRSALFFEFIRLLKEIKPKYFLLENVKMKKEFLEVITDQVSACYPEFQGKDLFGGRIEPILINSALVSAQSRQRYYWTNIPNVEQPEDLGIVLRDILEDDGQADLVGNGGREAFKENIQKGTALLARDWKGWNTYGMTGVQTTPKQVGIASDIKGHDILKRVYSPDGKSPTLNTMGGGNREPKVVSGGALRARSKDKDGKNIGWKETKPTQMLELRKDEKANAVSTVSKDSLVVNSYREVRTEEGKKARRDAKLKTGKDHTPFRSKELIPRTDGKVGTITPNLNKDHEISIEKNKTNQINPSKKASGRQPYIQERVFHKDGKSHALTESFADRTNIGEHNELTWRKLTPLECERLQTVPDNYTNHVSKTQRYKMLGNGWTVDVIAHILSNMESQHD
jgi:DNA (cytosine-5)-methyltransferase 3A